MRRPSQDEERNDYCRTASFAQVKLGFRRWHGWPLLRGNHLLQASTSVES